MSDPMVKDSAYQINLKAIDGLDPGEVSDPKFQLFKESDSSPKFEKTLNNGVTITPDGWLVQLSATDMNFLGVVHMQFLFTHSGEEYKIKLGTDCVENSR